MTTEFPEQHQRRGVTRRTFLGMSLASGAALLAGKSDVIFGAQSSTTPKMAMNTTFRLGSDLTVNRLGFGAMRIT
ncbi:MAG: twin-arginine translocation signal domain-containing protein, partial [Limisphaerales bacterium]